MIETDNYREEVEELVKRGFSIDDNGKITAFNANFFADYINNRLDILYAKDDFFYLYRKQEGYWAKYDDLEILTMLRDILQEPRFGVWTKRREDEYIVALKREVYYNGDLNPFRNIINMKNGVYDLETFTFKPHSKEYLSTIQIPIDYIEDAPRTRFLQFVDEIFEGDEERIAVAQEWYGYSLTMETKAQKALILYGNGGNGKGVFTDILSDLVGEDNISHIPLNELSKGFSRVCLHNKTLNISNENETNGKALNTQYFKAIVGEDKINAEQKGKPVFSFKPTVKLILSMNNLPLTKDKSTGYYRRLSILEPTASFSDEERDEDLKEKLKEELSGIFLWAVEGLRRLRENGFKFSQSTHMNQILKEYQEEQNPMLEFFEECIVKEDDKDYREDNRVVIKSFTEWASKNGHNGYANISTKRFWREFEGIAKRKGYKLGKGKSNKLRYHTGLRVVEEYRVVIKEPRKRPLLIK